MQPLSPVLLEIARSREAPARRRSGIRFKSRVAGRIGILLRINQKAAPESNILENIASSSRLAVLAHQYSTLIAVFDRYSPPNRFSARAIMTTFKWDICPGYAVFCFFLLFFTGGYPGAINPDTADILHQARNLVVTDWHSPVAVFLISFLIPISRTPQDVLFFQSLTCAAFLVVLISVVFSRCDDAVPAQRSRMHCVLTGALLFVLGLCLFALQCFILKDSWITIGYLGLVAALLNRRDGGSNPALGFVLILIPSLIRPTSFVATIPFAYYLLKRDVEAPDTLRWLRTGSSVTPCGPSRLPPPSAWRRCRWSYSSIRSLLAPNRRTPKYPCKCSISPASPR